MKRNFLFTVIFSFFVAVGIIAYFVWRIPPDSRSILAVLALVGYCVSVVMSLILYKLAKPCGHESERQVFRRQFKKGAVVGLFVIILLLIQKFFDVL